MAECQSAKDAVPEGEEHDEALVAANNALNAAILKVEEARRALDPAAAPAQDGKSQDETNSDSATSAFTPGDLEAILEAQAEASRQQIASLQSNFEGVLQRTLQEVSRAANANTVQGRQWNHAGIGFNAKIAGVYASLDGNNISCGIE
jgi:hypothetical protein